jgi:hypothetical protein
MTSGWQPGMKFYEASFWRNGEELFRMHGHAADEADMIARTRAGFEDLVRRGLIEGSLEGATAEVRLRQTTTDPEA